MPQRHEQEHRRTQELHQRERELVHLCQLNGRLWDPPQPPHHEPRDRLQCHLQHPKAAYHTPVQQAAEPQPSLPVYDAQTPVDDLQRTRKLAMRVIQAPGAAELPRTHPSKAMPKSCRPNQRAPSWLKRIIWRGWPQRLRRRKERPLRRTCPAQFPVACRIKKSKI